MNTKTTSKGAASADVAPATYTVYVTRENGAVEYRNVVTFEAKSSYYKFGLANGTEVILPYGREMYGIEAIPDEV